jgi:hypothetical protein
LHAGLQIEKERIVGAIVQGFTCLAPQTPRNLALEDCPMMVRLNNSNREQQSTSNK